MKKVEIKTPESQVKYIGKAFGDKTIISYYKKVMKTHYFNFICKCGNEGVGSIHNFKTSKRCVKCCSVKHGGAKDPHYMVFFQIKDRCFNPKNKNYHNYGGRGITMCDEWRSDYSKFIEDMGYRPTNKHSLDRINNNGNYCKENCRWVTQDVQCKNTRRNYKVYSELVSKTFNSPTDCAEYFKYSPQYIYDMLSGRRTNKLKITKIN